MDKKTKKVCFVGAPSTGKTTLAKQFVEELTKKNYSVELVGEFARDYIIEHGPIKSPVDQLFIARGQKEKEKIAYSNNPEFIICDAASFLSQVYFDFLKDSTFEKDRIEELKKTEKEIWLEIDGEINSYDFVFFLPPEFSPQEDGVRLYTENVREISDRIKGFLNFHKIQHHELKGSVRDRIFKASEIIELG